MRRNQLRPRADPHKSAAGYRLSAGDTSTRVRMPSRGRRPAEYIIKQTARGRRSLSANASGWITAPCVDVRPTASALIRRHQRYAPARCVERRHTVLPPQLAGLRRLYIVAVRRAVANVAD